MALHSRLSSIYFSHLDIYKVVAAQRTGALVAALEPAEQTDRVEGVLAGCAALVRSLHVGRDNRVANRTLALALQGALDVAAECEQPINQVTIGKHDNALDGEQPALPLLFIHEHSAAANNKCGMQGVCRW